MYKIKRQGHITEQLQIEDHGKELTLDVDVYVDQITGDYIELGSRLNQLRQQAQQQPASEELLEEFGKVVTDYFVLFFGQEQTGRLLEFYENRYHEMLLDITPFLQDVIVPAIKAAQDETARRYTAMARRGKK